VDATPAREQIEKLKAQGLGPRAIASAAGVQLNTVLALAGGYKGRSAYSRCRPETERGILAIDLDALDDDVYVWAANSWELINDLLAGGWRKCEVARSLGFENGDLILGKKRISNAMRKKIAEVFWCYWLDNEQFRFNCNRTPPDCVLEERNRRRYGPGYARASAASPYSMTG
jgi:hypothetical protein